MAMPDDNLVQAERARRRRPVLQTPGGAGSPAFEAPGLVPTTAPSAAVAGPMTRTVPGAFPDSTQAREQLKLLQKQRMRDINTALTTNDPAERATAIGARDSAEGDIRAIGAGLPRSYVTP